MRGGDLTIKILEAIFEGAARTTDLIAAILESGYGASLSRMEYNLRARQRQRNRREHEFEEWQKVYVRLSQLKRQGFIQQKEGGWKITNFGKNKLQKLKTLLSKKLPEKRYIKEPDNEWKIIVFDIPEKQRHKRRWLRSVLDSLGFKMLQKSVWIGKARLPEDFLDDLKQLKIFSFIEILAISKSGTIKEIIK